MTYNIIPDVLLPGSYPRPLGPNLPKAEEMIMTQIISLKIPSVDIDAARWLLIAATKKNKPIIRINEGMSTFFSELYHLMNDFSIPPLKPAETYQILL